MDEKLAFLCSTRFWAYVIGAVGLAMGPDGIFTGPEIHTALMSLVAAFAGTKTFDRAVDKLSENKLPVTNAEV